jgi:hypothetical protein
MQQQKKTAAPDFNAPEILAERNRLIAERIGLKLDYGPGKVEDMRRKIDILAADPAPRKLLEYIYEKLWMAKPGISREDVQAIFASCHSEALDRLQSPEDPDWN